MTKTIWTGACSAIVGIATVCLAAQTPSSPPQQSTPSSPAPQSSAASDHKITVTGCLRAAPPTSASDVTSATGTAGTTGTAGAAGAAGAPTDAAATAQKFVLTNAVVSTPAASPDAAAAGAAAPATTPATTPAPSSASASGQTYRLVANPAALSPHVGKKLELTGTLEENGAASAGASSDPATANTPALKVEAGKVLAASCSQ